MTSLGLNSIPSLLRRLETGTLPSPHSFHGHLSTIPAMRRHYELRGHQGCVNRLALSDDAATLISASDDCTLRLWDVATCTERATLAPGHESNVFGVTFMPHTNNSFVASAGFDHQVRYTSVETGSSTLWTCHQDSVKMVTAASPHVFISASIDGTARQFDARIPPYNTKYSASTILVRIAGSGRRFRGLFSAALSPISDNHLLVAATEPCLRIYDRRKCGSPIPRHASSDRNLHPSSIGECVQKLTPPHMHDSAPETVTCGPLPRSTHATFATYSPDGRQVVASFYDDIVHVFDLPNHTQPTACLRPFRSRKQLRGAVFVFLQEAVRALTLNPHSRSLSHVNEALASANQALEIDPGNVLALVLKAEALLDRKKFGDMREAYAALTEVIRVVKEDVGRIAQLWGMHSAEGEMCMSPNAAGCATKAEIWQQVFLYKQAYAMHHMIPTRIESFDLHGIEMTRKRMAYLDAFTARLEEYRATRMAPKMTILEWTRALGDSNGQSLLYRNSAAEQRARFLERLFSNYAEGLPMLRRSIQIWTSSMRRPAVEDNDEEVQSESDSVDSCSTDSVDDLAEDKIEALKLFERRRQGTLGGKQSASLWGPPPSAQEGWRGFCGHISTETDIKEARFYGSNNQVVLSGSDDGNVYMWAARTGKLLATVQGDHHIVNCVLPHPRREMIFVSGIDYSVKVLTPRGPSDDTGRRCPVLDFKTYVDANLRMSEGVSWGRAGTAINGDGAE